MIKNMLCFVVFFGIVSASSLSVAQNGEQGQDDGVPERLRRAVDPSVLPSILFTFDEYQEIINAKNARGLARPVMEGELERGGEESDSSLPPPEMRYVRLAGIVFKSEKDWTIWLNEKHVTPDALPEEILDLKVFEQYIEMKWYDTYTKQIIPIRLRPHQRFHLDARIFLPG